MLPHTDVARCLIILECARMTALEHGFAVVAETLLHTYATNGVVYSVVMPTLKLASWLVSILLLLLLS